MQIGVLSDTHRNRVDSEFQRWCDHCFARCSVIIHAGDLTDVAVLDAFGDKTVYAVHGNMCRPKTKSQLPKMLSFCLGGYRFGLHHGAGLGADSEGALFLLFPEADCIISGHTHRPVCRRYGQTLFVNPGSFIPHTRNGMPGTYAILKTEERLTGSIFEVQHA